MQQPSIITILTVQTNVDLRRVPAPVIHYISDSEVDSVTKLLAAHDYSVCFLEPTDDTLVQHGRWVSRDGNLTEECHLQRVQ